MPRVALDDNYFHGMSGGKGTVRATPDAQFSFKYSGDRGGRLAIQRQLQVDESRNDVARAPRLTPTDLMSPSKQVPPSFGYLPPATAAADMTSYPEQQYHDFYDISEMPQQEFQAAEEYYCHNPYEAWQAYQDYYFSAACDGAISTPEVFTIPTSCTAALPCTEIACQELPQSESYFMNCELLPPSLRVFELGGCRDAGAESTQFDEASWLHLSVAYASRVHCRPDDVVLISVQPCLAAPNEGHDACCPEGVPNVFLSDGSHFVFGSRCDPNEMISRSFNTPTASVLVLLVVKSLDADGGDDLFEGEFGSCTPADQRCTSPTNPPEEDLNAMKQERRPPPVVITEVPPFPLSLEPTPIEPASAETAYLAAASVSRAAPHFPSSSCTLEVITPGRAVGKDHSHERKRAKRENTAQIPSHPVTRALLTRRVPLANNVAPAALPNADADKLKPRGEPVPTKPPASKQKQPKLSLDEELKLLEDYAKAAQVTTAAVTVCDSPPAPREWSVVCHKIINEVNIIRQLKRKASTAWELRATLRHALNTFTRVSAQLRGDQPSTAEQRLCCRWDPTVPRLMKVTFGFVVDLLTDLRITLALSSMVCESASDRALELRVADKTAHEYTLYAASMDAALPDKGLVGDVALDEFICSLLNIRHIVISRGLSQYMSAEMFAEDSSTTIFALVRDFNTIVTHIVLLIRAHLQRGQEKLNWIMQPIVLDTLLRALCAVCEVVCSLYIAQINKPFALLADTMRRFYELSECIFGSTPNEFNLLQNIAVSCADLIRAAPAGSLHSDALSALEQVSRLPLGPCPARAQSILSSLRRCHDKMLSSKQHNQGLTETIAILEAQSQTMPQLKQLLSEVLFVTRQ